MLAEQAVRHQMVLPLQQSLFDYWRSKCVGGKLPARSDIDPCFMKEHLPTVSITELDRGQGRVRFKLRLVGTGFWELFEDEIQGRYVDELPIGDKCQYWQRVLTQVMTTKRPAAGVLARPGTPYRAHLSQFWIRLPLSENGTDVNMILGYDHLVKASDLRKMVGLTRNENRLTA